MIVLSIKNEQVKEAETLYEFNNLKNSITRGKSQIFGAVGEILVRDYYLERGFDVTLVGSYDYDLLINGYKVDVKTKRTTVEPKPYYNCSISNSNTTQGCDFYYFVRISEDLRVGYLLGYRQKSYFYKEAIFNKKGDCDGGWKFKDDCWNMPILKLHTPCS